MDAPGASVGRNTLVTEWPARQMLKNAEDVSVAFTGEAWMPFNVTRE